MCDAVSKTKHRCPTETGRLRKQEIGNTPHMQDVFVTLQVTDSAGGPGFKGLVTMTGLQGLRMKQQQQALTFSCPDYISGARKTVTELEQRQWTGVGRAEITGYP